MSALPPGFPDPAEQLPAWHGRRVNYSALARGCGVCCQTVRRHLLDLEQAGVVRLLRPLGEAGGKAPAPVLYLRAPHLVAALSEAQRWRVRLVDEIAALAEAGGARIGCLVRPHGCVVEPVVEVPAAGGPALVGFALCAETVLRRRLWAGLTRAQRLGLLRQGFVLYPGSRAYFSSARVAVVPEANFLQECSGWLAAALAASPEAVQSLMRRCNAPRVR